MTPTQRKRRPKTETYTDWMARIDGEVDQVARQMEREPPTYADLHPAQRRIVEMLIEHLRSLPELKSGEGGFGKREYLLINLILGHLYEAKYPEWNKLPGKDRYVDALPNGEGDTFKWMLRNAAGRAPAEIAKQQDEEDDD